jgi:hypothetical protein
MGIMKCINCFKCLFVKEKDNFLKFINELYFGIFFPLLYNEPQNLIG